MKMHLLKFFLLNLILLNQIHGRKACFEEERKGLLELKSFLKLEGYDSDHVLDSWDDDDPESDCCGWERVTCNSTTGRVIQLSLFNLRQQDTASCQDYFSCGQNPEPRRWNITLFKPFKELRILDLSYNEIYGWIHNQGSKSFLRLQQLETLDLSGNSFSNLALQSLMNLTSLKNLILRDNYFGGSFPPRELSVFENLETLDLSGNHLIDPPSNFGMGSLSKLRHLRLQLNFFSKDIMRFLGSLPSLRSLDLSFNLMGGSLSNHELATLRNLEVLHLRFNDIYGNLPIKDLITFERLEILDLSHNNFDGSIPQDIGKISSLKALYLSSNWLDGSLPNPGVCELKGLQKLDIGHNSLGGILPLCLNNLTSLRILYLHDNLFSGSTLAHLISSLKSLQCIDFSGNDFEGSFLFSSIFNHSKLEVLIVGSRGQKLQIDTETRACIKPQFQLKALGLSDCNLKSTPTFLLNQHRLKAIDLSHNKLNGEFPSWLLENNTDLEVLNLRNNTFTGRFHLPEHPMREMIIIDLSYNHLGGHLPKDLGMVLFNLKCLNLSVNYFQGDLPTSIGGMRKLEKLDLSSNNFTGELPKDLVQNCIHLRQMMLSNNNFQGEFFSIHFNLTHLECLGLGNNQFTGSPANMDNDGRFLYLFDVNNNKMTGKIPSWISNVVVLAMRNNSFEGQFPCNQPFILTRFIDLSNNFLSGPLPSCFGMEFMEQIHLEGNNFSGSIPNALLNSSSLLVLNLRDNHLSGKIPSPIGSFPNLRVLLLGNNHLCGSIPSQMCQLRKINIMDLSNNSFSGSIPSCLSNVALGTAKDSYFDIGTEVYMDYSDSDTEERLEYSYFVHNMVFPDEGISSLTDHPILLSLDEIEINIVTKSNLMSYKHYILNYMSGLDLSCNNLTGEIPKSFGKLSSIHALNLSHNHLIGSIPISFSNLTKLESLDLSYNNLSGKIPSNLVNLNFLEVFSVAHNNLSGRVPDKGQFATFGSSSYEGNPFLYGLPSERNRTKAIETPSNPSEEKWYEIDQTYFFASFVATYFVFLLAFGVLLYINPYWRRRWFYFIENFLYFCYYFVLDTFRKLSACFNN